MLTTSLPQIDPLPFTIKPPSKDIFQTSLLSTKLFKGPFPWLEVETMHGASNP